MRFVGPKKNPVNQFSVKLGSNLEQNAFIVGHEKKITTLIYVYRVKSKTHTYLCILFKKTYFI